MQPWDQVKARLAELGIKGIAVQQDGYKALAEALRDNEYIYTAVAGEYEGSYGAVAATDQRLLFVARKRGFLSKSLRTEEFTYSSISSVETKQGTVFASVKVYVSGNTATIDKVPNPLAVTLADTIKQCIASAKAPAPTTMVQASTTDVATQLEKLANLRAQGILTDEEFNAQKQKLLNS